MSGPKAPGPRGGRHTRLRGGLVAILCRRPATASGEAPTGRLGPLTPAGPQPARGVWLAARPPALPARPSPGRVSSLVGAETLPGVGSWGAPMLGVLLLPSPSQEPVPSLLCLQRCRGLKREKPPSCSVHSTLFYLVCRFGLSADSLCNFKFPRPESCPLFCALEVSSLSLLEMTRFSTHCMLPPHPSCP